MKPLIVPIAAIVLLSVSTNSRTDEQEVELFMHGELEVHVSQTQHERLSKLVDARATGITKLEAQSSAAYRSLLGNKLDLEARIYDELSPAQQSRLQDSRRRALREQTHRDVAFLKTFAELSPLIAGAQAITIYEGPARGTDEQIARRNREAKLVQLNGYDFYEKPLTPKTYAMAQLHALIADYSSFGPYLGGKFCGGFHPDLCLEWQADGRPHRMYLCLGCAEARIVTPKHDVWMEIEAHSYSAISLLANKIFAHRSNSGNDRP